MVSFYCVDGPMEGQCVVSNFRESEHDGANYKKTTFGCMVKKDDRDFRVLCDVAWCDSEPQSMPSGARGNVAIQEIHKPIPDLTCEIESFIKM